LKISDYMRIAVIDKELCKSDKCQKECIAVCPINRTGKRCIYLGEDTKSVIDETLCIGCGICVKKCPFKAISVVNTPEKLKEDPVYRYGQNGFTLFRLPFPIKGEVVGLLGPNGVGKTTALNILSGKIKIKEDIIKAFRGTELQSHLEKIKHNEIKSVIKPQQIEIFSKIDKTVNEILDDNDEKNIKQDIIDKLHLYNFLNRKLSQLSGGELQRVAIATTIMKKADIYYIDEPTSYLDVYQRLNVAKIIRELSKDAAVLVVEHDLATLDFLADRIHIFYGVPGVYGIVSKPYGVRVGINTFLDGYIKEDNVRIRDKIDFNIGKTTEITEHTIILQWPEIEKKLDGFELRVEKGHIYDSEVLGIFGSNALGKTTFAKILAGEIKPDKGNIDKEIKIAYKPQYIQNNFDTIVKDVISSVTKIDNDFMNIIGKPLNLEKIFEQNIRNLSGGELQRVAIAIALSRKSDMILMDEPSAFLDVEQRLHVAKLIRHISEMRKCPIIIIDHDLLFLSYLADRAMLFSGEPSKKGFAIQTTLQDGFNKFLKDLNITFRKDETGRPRANKPGSVKDNEQKQKNIYFYI